MTAKKILADPESLRESITTSIPSQTTQFGNDLIDRRFLYLPRAHLGALDVNCMLVVGIRGAGKSFWWNALQSAPHRQLLARSLQKAEIDDKTDVSAGFGNTPSKFYPNKDVLTTLLAKHKARHIWLTVVLWQCCSDLPPLTKWAERVAWVTENPEEVAQHLSQANDDLVKSGRKRLILFDALDRTADEWDKLSELLRGLLELLLDLRSSPAIRAKAFVRPDMLEASEITSFRDSSKVLSSRVDLRWARADLYGLLWQYMGNADEGASEFRRLISELFDDGGTEKAGIWTPPKELRREESAQRLLFDAIAGKWMGRDRRRGFPYTWLPNHLADALDQTSPRSFLAALRAAGSDERHRAKGLALHYEAIKRGVQAASKIRVDEIGEDFPWTLLAMKPLENLVIPCAQAMIGTRWKKAGVVDQIRAQKDRKPRQLPRGEAGLFEALAEIGLFKPMSEDRINVPDVYRLGFGLRRRGGLSPLK
jgi:hypothetical protein